jgi:hypothetical protein
MVIKTYIGLLYIMSTLFCQDNKVSSSNFQRAIIKNYLLLVSNIFSIVY